MFYEILVVIFFIQSVHLCTEQCSGNNNNQMMLIIDTDAGGDDAVAILLLLANKNIDVMAITCTYGNTDEPNVEHNVLKILTIANRTNIPVYGGVPKPLIKNYTAGDMFGSDGFGDFQFDQKLNITVDESKNAVTAILDLSKTYKNKINILTLGSLTNIAIAASLDPVFTRRINKFYVMGSQVDESNDSSNVEFNFGLDPESTKIFLGSLTHERIFIFPWDVALKEPIDKKWRTDVLGNVKTGVIKYINKIEGVILEKSPAWYVADAVTAAILLWPEIAMNITDMKMTSMACGDANGSVHVDLNVPNEQKNVQVVRSINVQTFKDKLLKCLC